MQVLLDTNVWSYIADHDAGDDLARTARANNISICVSPTVIAEVQALPNADALKRALLLTTRRDWVRLMPDAYSECLEVKAEIIRLRPEWVINNPNLKEVNRLQYDWKKRKNGFWARARDNVSNAPTDESLRAQNQYELARSESYEMRDRISEKKQSPAHTHLQRIFAVPDESNAGWNGSPISYWRVPSLNFFRRELLIYSSPIREWLDAELNIALMIKDLPALGRFWLHDASEIALPRQWLRGAFEFLQGWHKVSNGTPTDSALATNLVAADYFISADKNFIRFANRCNTEAPFITAKSRRVSAGRLGVDETLGLIGQLKP